MEKRFRALRTIATIYKILAWLVLIFGVVVALAFFVHTLFGDATSGGWAVARLSLFHPLASYYMLALFS